MHPAERKGETKPEHLIANFKMDMVRSNADQRRRAGELVQDFFTFLYQAYASQREFPSGIDVTEQTFISYPAKWPDEIRRATLEAATRAGFPDVRGMDEPSAALHYFMVVDTEDTRRLTRARILQDGRPLIVLLIDMGAGTTDLVLYHYVPGPNASAEVLATWPPVDDPGTFGGSEIDQILALHLQRYLDQNLPHPPSGSFLSNILPLECKSWKESSLSRDLDEDKPPGPPSLLTRFEQMGGGLRAPLAPLNRTSFGDLVGDYLPVFPRLLQGLLAQAEKRLEAPGAAIDLVVLTGGHSQWYFVREMLRGQWVPGLPGQPGRGSGVHLAKILQEPFRILTTPRPQETVACGLALSGLPLHIRKLATNNTWLKLELGYTTFGPIQISKMGEILPCEEQISRYLFQIQSTIFARTINGQAISLAGRTLETAKEMSPIDFTLTTPASEIVLKILLSPVLGIARLLGYSASYYDNDVYIEFAIDEEQHLSARGVIGLARRGRSSDPPRRWEHDDLRFFAIGRDELTKKEEKVVVENMYNKLDGIVSELCKICGTWSLESSVNDGKKMSSEEAVKLKRIFTSEWCQVQKEGQTQRKGAYWINPYCNPKSIYIGDWNNIYEVDGDTLKLCLAVLGKEPPTEFSSKPGSGHVLEIYRRERS